MFTHYLVLLALCSNNANTKFPLNLNKPKQIPLDNTHTHTHAITMLLAWLIVANQLIRTSNNNNKIKPSYRYQNNWF